MSETSYEVTARKYRPRSFAEVVGQDHVTRTLQNALKEKRIHHAYLFTGPRGTGKTTTARLLAMALNCKSSDDMVPEPCGTCESCQAIVRGNSVDVLEIDGASNRGIDDARDLRERIGYAALEGRFKVYIIDEVHQITKDAFNALLKTLEEPPKHVVFIFATTEPSKVLPTIMSRVQRYDFRRIGEKAIVETLQAIAGQEGLQTDEEALHLIARKADGALRDAESLLDQVRAFAGENITLENTRSVLGVVDTDRLFELTRVSAENDARGAMALASTLVEEGQDPREFMLSYAEHLRYLIAASVGGEAALELLPVTERDRYLQEAGRLRLEDFLRRFELVSRAAQGLKDSPQPWIALEVLFLQLSHLDHAVDLRTLLDRLEGGPGGVQPSAPPAPGPGTGGTGSAGGGTGGPAGPNQGGGAPPTGGGKDTPSPAEPTVAQARSGGARMVRDASEPPGAGRPGKPEPVPPPAPTVESKPAPPAEPPTTGPPAPPPEAYEEETEVHAGRRSRPREDNGRGVLATDARSKWPDILEEVRRHKVSLHAFLAEAELTDVEENHLVLAFRGENHTFHMNMVSRHAELIREITREVLGHAMGVRCVRARTPSPASGDDPNRARDLNQELLERLCDQDPNLKAIVGLFEARLEDGHGGRPEN